MTKIFSFIFFSISLWIGLSAILSHIVATYNLSYDYYYFIWIGSFFISISLFLRPILSERKILQYRFSKSTSWPTFIKIMNGLSWSLPFFLLIFFYKYYPFLLIAGLSSGNISTFIFLRKYSNLYSVEQIITGVSLLFALIVIIIYSIYSDNYDVILLLSRIMIAFSYGVGGFVGYFNSIKGN